MCCLLLIKVLKLADREWSRFQLKGLAHWKGQLSCDPALVARVGSGTLETFLILFLLIIVRESSCTSMCCKRRQNKLSVHLRHHNVWMATDQTAATTWGNLDTQIIGTAQTEWLPSLLIIFIDSFLMLSVTRSCEEDRTPEKTNKMSS